MTKPEHILLNGLGGRKTTKRVTCTTCNQTFGDTIDKEMVESVEAIRNMLQLPSGSGSPPPPLKRVKSGNDLLNIGSDGTPRVLTKPFTTTERPDGNIQLQIMAQSQEELARLVPHIAAKLRISEQQVWDALGTATGRVISKRPEAIHLPLSFGKACALRSLTKMCLELWATVAGNADVRSPAYEAARQFVTEGDAEFVRERLRLDSRLIPNGEALKDRFGKLFNLLYVANDARGRVIGHFTLYNMIGWRVVLAEHGGFNGSKIALISNPLDPGNWSDSIAQDCGIDFSWLDTPDGTGDIDSARARVIAVVQHYYETATPRQWERIIDDVFQRQGFIRDEPLPPLDEEHARKIAGEISARIVAMRYNLPYEETLSGDTLRRYLERARQKTK
jgi:hypothetical protein